MRINKKEMSDMTTVHTAQDKLSVTMGTDQIVTLVLQPPFRFLPADLAVEPAHLAVWNTDVFEQTS